MITIITPCKKCKVQFTLGEYQDAKDAHCPKCIAEFDSALSSFQNGNKTVR